MEVDHQRAGQIAQRQGQQIQRNDGDHPGDDAGVTTYGMDGIPWASSASISSAMRMAPISAVIRVPAWAPKPIAIRHEMGVHHVDMQPVGTPSPPRLRRRAGRNRRPISTALSAVPPVLRDMSDTLLAAQRGGEHGVGAVPVRPELHIGTVAKTVGDRQSVAELFATAFRLPRGETLRTKVRRSNRRSPRSGHRHRRPGGRAGAASADKRTSVANLPRSPSSTSKETLAPRVARRFSISRC